jgi:hypothetical protein
MEHDGNAQPRILENPPLEEVPVLRADPGLGRIACASEFVEERVGAQAVARDLFGQRFIELVFSMTDGKLKPAKEGNVQPLSSWATFSSTDILPSRSRTRSGTAAFESL